MTNQVTNGDFETGDFTGWTPEVNYGHGTLTVDSSVKHSGNYSAKFAYTNTDEWLTLLSDFFTPIEGMVVGFWMKVQTLPNRATVELYNGAGHYILLKAANATYDWTYFSKTLTAANVTSMGSSCGFLVTVDDATYGSALVYVDDFGATPPIIPPVASFSEDKTTLVSGGTVTFTDTSTKHPHIVELELRRWFVCIN